MRGWPVFWVFSLLFVLTNIESTLQRNAVRGWWAAGASHEREIKTIPRRTKQEKQTFLWYLDVILLYAVYRAVTGVGRHGRGKLNEKLLWRWEHAGCLLGRRFLSGKIHSSFSRLCVTAYFGNEKDCGNDDTKDWWGAIGGWMVKPDVDSEAKKRRGKVSSVHRRLWWYPLHMRSIRGQYTANNLAIKINLNYFFSPQ